jgi:hypothetical protein
LLTEREEAGFEICEDRASKVLCLALVTGPEAAVDFSSAKKRDEVQWDPLANMQDIVALFEVLLGHEVRPCGAICGASTAGRPLTLTMALAI